MNTMDKTRRTLVWDIPTRLFHWALVGAVLYAWFAVEVLEDMQQHFYAGYAVLALLLFRIVWGFVGSVYARFAEFLYSPKTIIGYAKTLPQKDSKAYAGHSPVGGLAVVLMLLVVLLQVGTGLFNSDDYFHGPLSGLVSADTRALLGEIHDFNFELGSVLVGLHVAAVLFYVLFKKQGLINAMFSGKKALGEAAATPIAGSRVYLAIVVLAIAAGLVYLIATGFTDSLPSSEYDYGY